MELIPFYVGHLLRTQTYYLRYKYSITGISTPVTTYMNCGLIVTVIVYVVCY